MKFNTTLLIQKRYELSEQMERSIINLYLSITKEDEISFNEDMKAVIIEDYESINDMLKEIKDLKKKRNEMVKTGASPQEIHEINKEIKNLHKKLKQDQVNKEILHKQMLAVKEKKENMDHDMNYNKYPDFHHHKDSQYEDTFNGIQQHFENIFGS